jgi:Trypsin-like peptidase domain
MRPLLLVLILCIGASFSTAVRCQPSPVLSSSGSGFFVSYDGHVLTNNHVVEDCSNLKVEQPGSGATIATVIARDVNNDLALLRTSSKPTMVPKFGSQARLGQSIYVLGFPMFPVLSSSGNFTLGSVTALTGPRDDTGLLQISAPVQPGTSGGPLLDKRGNAVGVIVARIEKLQNVNFAIKSSIALNFLFSNGVGAKESETMASELPPEEIADLAKTFTVRILCYTTAVAAAPAAPPDHGPLPPRTNGNPCANNALKRTYWMHNGSVLCLVAETDMRAFFYHRPRPGMTDAGVKPGDLLFSGRAIDMHYIGTAYLFKSRCGKFGYEVRGDILDDYHRVKMYGQAPRLDDNCNVIGKFDDTLEFSYMN